VRYGLGRRILSSKSAIVDNNGASPELDNLAGQRVTVKGTIKGDLLTVESLTAATKAAR